MNNYLWILDPGHGGRDFTPGKRSPIWSDGTQYFEGEGNRIIASKVGVLLAEKKIRHLFTVHPSDMRDVPLHQRTRYINSLADRRIVVSIHSDAYDDPKAHGHSIYTSVGQTFSDTIATVFYNQFKILFPDETFRTDYADGDPDKENQFWILRKSNCPAILIENFFHTNERECRTILMNVDGQNKIAQCIAAAIIQIELKEA